MKITGIHTQPFKPALILSIESILHRETNIHFLILNNKNMKTLKRISPIMILIAVILVLASGCAKDSSNLTKSSMLNLSLSTTKSAVLKNVATDFTLNSALINISDLVIEENSGNDVEQDGNHNDGGNDSENDSGNEAGGEQDDIILPGPYTLDVLNGTVSIDQVAVYPGTFKKVDFTFVTSTEADFGGNSIVVTGSYQQPGGTVVPVVLRSAFSETIQLPLAGNGLTVADNSTVSITIVLDIPSWINNLDLSGAVLTNSEIIIDNTVNEDLLNLFEANLVSSIEVED